MTVHTVHPDTHEHGLADGCPICAEHAEHPFQSLDRRNLAALHAQVRAVESGLVAGYRSANEARAAHHLIEHALQAGRLRETQDGYDSDDPKADGYHDRHADTWDLRDKPPGAA